VNDLRVTLSGEALEALVELVTERVLSRLAEAARDDERELLTTAEYAARFRTTPGAVQARIARKTLEAIHPPGAREWLIPVPIDGDGAGPYDAKR
jgi:hypothetical protein